MRCAKVAISIDEDLLREVDSLVYQGAFRNRSRMIGAAVSEKLDRIRSGRLARECARLDPIAEQALADEGIDSESEKWPEY